MGLGSEHVSQDWWFLEVAPGSKLSPLARIPQEEGPVSRR